MVILYKKRKKEKKRKPAGVLIGIRLNLKIDNFINIDSPNAQTRASPFRSVFTTFYKQCVTNSCQSRGLAHFLLKLSLRILTHHWWELKMVKPHQKTVGQFLKKLSIKLPLDPAIPPLDIYPRGTRTSPHEDQHVNVHGSIILSS